MISHRGIHSGASYVASLESSFESYSFFTNAIVELELNMNDRALFFWVNERLVPRTIINIPSNVYFGV
jgi:hypothetical protein